jgi:prepilin-type N-terminal cleavage/methylation domain-containing protein
MRLSAPDTTEQGFTLIELMVAMVLGLIVMALLIGLVMDMFTASERSALDNKAQKAASLAADMLTSDVRAMRAPQREPKFTGSPDNLRAMFLDPDGNPNNYEIHDVTYASPQQITFLAEVANTTAGVECVTWQVQPDKALHRIVRAHSVNCAGGGGGVISTQLVMPAPETAKASAAAAVPNPFSYRLLAVTKPPVCAETNVTTGVLKTLERDQISNVMLDLRSFVAGRAATGDQQLKTSVTISSRQGMEYRYGIGCVA